MATNLHICANTGTSMSTTIEDRDGRTIPETCVGCGRRVEDCTAPMKAEAFGNQTTRALSKRKGSR